MSKFLNTIVVITMILCTGCKANFPFSEKINSFFVASTATSTIAPTIPAPTSTPMPKMMSLVDVFDTCDTIDPKQTIIIEGNIFLPIKDLIGYAGLRGLHLTSFLSTDGIMLVALVKVGETPNTMDALPEGMIFGEKDLLIHAYDGQVIRHGGTVILTGHADYKNDQYGSRCELSVEKIVSKTDRKTLEPIELNIGDLAVLTDDSLCAILAGQKQFVKIHGEIEYPKDLVIPNLGVYTIPIKNDTSKIMLSILEGEGPNSMTITSDSSNPENWKLFDASGQISKENDYWITGVPYFSYEACTIMVYKIESIPVNGQEP